MDQMSIEAAGSPEENAAPRKLRELIQALAGTVNKRLSPGEVAELRRLDPRQPGSPAFWKLAALHLGDNKFWWIGGGDDRDEVERRWAAVFSFIALAGGFHQPHAPLGTALANAGFHELRFTRLLRARGGRLLDELSTTVRFLVAKAESFDVRELAALIASSDHPQWAERVRRQVARGYYFSLNGKEL